MKSGLYILAAVIMGIPTMMWAQSDYRAYLYSGIVYDEQFRPVPYTHVIAHGSGQGDVTDTLGIFSLYVRETDRLSFYNLTCRDTSVFISYDDRAFYIKLKRKVYPLKEARIFEWGSSYGDFLDEIERRGVPVSAGEEIGLPRQDPDLVPFDRDEKKLKSAGFLLSSPISFFYYNLSKYEKSARKVYRLQKDGEKIKLFEELVSPGSLSTMSGLLGKDLDELIMYVNANLKCDFTCPELEIISELHALLRQYREKKIIEN